MPISIKIVNVTILHSLDGYDEVSLTKKIITSSMEGVLNPADFGVNLLSQSEIQGDKQLKRCPSSLVMERRPKTM
jgi:anthranilate phosphoribosyltransferase